LAPPAGTCEYISAHEIRFSPGGNFASDEIGRCPDYATPLSLLFLFLGRRLRDARHRLGYGRAFAVTYWKSTFVAGSSSDVAEQNARAESNLDPDRAGFV